MWTCWFYKCATISPTLPKHCHELRVLHSRCLLLIIEKLIGFMSGTGQYQPSSAIIIGMLAGSRSCFTSNNSSMLLHSPLKRWKLEEYGYHWGAGPAISPAQIFTHTHMNQGASREVCVTMKVRERESVNKEQHDTQADETRVKEHSVSSQSVLVLQEIPVYPSAS